MIKNFALSLVICAGIVSAANYSSADETPTVTPTLQVGDRDLKPVISSAFTDDGTVLTNAPTPTEMAVRLGLVADRVDLYTLRVATNEGSIDFKPSGDVIGGGPHWSDRKPILLAQADTGSAAVPHDAPAEIDPLTELAALKAKYDALKTATPDVKMLAWAALIAGALKLLLSLFNRYLYKETKRWTKWAALGAAVPIALLSYYALGNGLFASLIYAGAGPGAIIVHELLQSAAPKKAEA